MPVAVEGGERFGQTRLTFSPGDRLVVYTDGLVDARQGDGHRLGLEPVARLTRSFVGTSQALAHSLLNLASEPLQDDVMILVIQCLAGSQGSPRKLKPGSKALCL